MRNKEHWKDNQVTLSTRFSGVFIKSPPTSPSSASEKGQEETTAPSSPTPSTNSRKSHTPMDPDAPSAGPQTRSKLEPPQTILAADDAERQHALVGAADTTNDDQSLRVSNDEDTDAKSVESATVANFFKDLASEDNEASKDSEIEATVESKESIGSSGDEEEEKRESYDDDDESVASMEYLWSWLTCSDPSDLHERHERLLKKRIDFEREKALIPGTVQGFVIRTRRGAPMAVAGEAYPLNGQRKGGLHQKQAKSMRKSEKRKRRKGKSKGSGLKTVEN
jgi:hypothetical protein